MDNLIKTGDFALTNNIHQSTAVYLPKLELSPELVKEVKKYPEELQKQLTSDLLESSYWYNEAHRPTPTNVICRRPHDDLEYVKEFYVLDEMDKLYPGWWQEDMKTVYSPESRTFTTTGYFCFEYMVLTGKKVRKLYAVGSSFVQGKKDDKSMPSQPDDMAKASLTEWIRIAGKRLGIARDIYSQEVTINLVREFEHRIKPIEQYAGELIEIARTLTKGSSFRNLLASMTTEQQISDFAEVIMPLPLDKKQGLWNHFLKFNNSTPEETQKITAFTNQIKEKLCQKI